MSLPPLKVKIGADTSDFENGLARASRGLKGMAKAAAAAGVIVAGALTAMTVQGLRAVDANTKLARSMDATVNGLRAVQIAAGYAGVSTGEANTAMQQLNRELVRAAEVGSPAYKALQKIGLSAADLSALDADDRMAAIADRMQEMGISAAQASDILRDLGVRSRDMSLLLLQGGDAIRSARDEVTAFGIELSEAQTAGIESANDALARMSLVFEGLRNQLAANVAPALQSVADKFNQLAQSQAAQDAIQRLVGAFTRLSEIILSEDFISVAVSAIEGMAGVAATAAELMVGFAQNIELVTIAFGGLAIAVAVAGGPLTIIIGALAVALGGIAMWRGAAEDAAKGSDAAAKAQTALNEALGVFYQTGAPSAGKAAVDLANDNYKLADSALAAAEAELAKRQAVLDAEEERLKSVNSGGGEFLSLGTSIGAQVDVGQAQSEMDAARARLEEARISLDRAVRSVTGSSYSSVSISPVDVPGIEPVDLTLPEAEGGGRVGAAQTEADELAAIEQELQDKLTAMREAANYAEVSMRERTVDMLGNLLTTLGRNSDVAAKAAVALNAARAIAEVIQNAAAAKVRAIAELGPVAGPPAAAKIGFYAAAQTAIIGANAALQIGKKSGGGGSSGGSGSGIASGGGTSQQSLMVDLQVSGRGDLATDPSAIDGLASALIDNFKDRGIPIMVRA